MITEKEAYMVKQIAVAYGLCILTDPANDRWKIEGKEFYWDSKMDMFNFWEKLRYYFFDQGFDEGLKARE